MKKLPNDQKLIPGMTYKSVDGDFWMCFKVKIRNEEHEQAYCINVRNHLIEYFFIDSRYDDEGEREHCLIERVNQTDPLFDGGNRRGGEY